MYDYIEINCEVIRIILIELKYLLMYEWVMGVLLINFVSDGIGVEVFCF